MKIKISNKWVGNNNPVFMIAEGGINHNGKLSFAKKIISKAKAAGADAVKFQTFKAEDLASSKSKYFKIFKKLELDFEEFGELSDCAKSQKIIFLSTPFSNDAVNYLHKINTPAFKIASGDLTNLPLIKHAASKKKPIILSTGMANPIEIRDAVKTIQSTNNKKIILMHSVSSYPAPINETNLLSIKYLKEKYSYPIGYSDNGKDLAVPLVAVILGAKIIEKHFTLNKKMKGPDHKLSADPSDFENLVKNIRNSTKMLGNGIKKCQPSELENRINARRSITSKINIMKNEVIKNDMITLNRPANGISPKFLTRVIGKKSKKKISAGDSIKWNDLR